jgi:hypothetical protein
LSDQIMAGVIMWVPGSLFFLVPGAAIIFNLLSARTLVTPSEGLGASDRGARRASSV